LLARPIAPPKITNFETGNCRSFQDSPTAAVEFPNVSAVSRYPDPLRAERFRIPVESEYLQKAGVGVWEIALGQNSGVQSIVRLVDRPRVVFGAPHFRHFRSGQGLLRERQMKLARSGRRSGHDGGAQLRSAPAATGGAADLGVWGFAAADLR